MKSVSTQRIALLALLLVSAVWGSSFPLTKVLLNEIGVLDFLAVRYVIAAAAAAAIFWRHLRSLTGRAILNGCFLGVIFGVAQLAQTFGLTHTSPSVSGFITGMYVVLTPLLAWLILQSAVSGRAWTGALVSMAGLGLLSLHGFSLGFGEAITLLSAGLFALHIVFLGHWASAEDAIGLSVVQLIAAAIVCVVVAAPRGIGLPSSGWGWTNLIFLAVVSGAVAMLLQSWAQAHLAANRAAVVMAMEPVWATFWSVLFFGEALTWRIMLGGTVMLAGMLIVELTPRRANDPPHIEDLPKLGA